MKKKLRKIVASLMVATIVFSSFTSVFAYEASALNDTMGCVERETGTISDLQNVKELLNDNNGINISTTRPLEHESDIAINADNFPDDEFRKIINSTFYDENQNGYLSEDEVNNIIEMNIYGGRSDVSSLKGIQYFKKLEKLSITNASITELILKGLDNLKSVECSSNENLSILNVEGLKQLQSLDCRYCNIDELDLSSLENLVSLKCENNSNLKVLNIEGLTKLQSISCDSCSIRKLDTSQLTELEELRCQNNQLGFLDLDQSEKLERLYLDGNPIYAVNLAEKNNIYYISGYNYEFQFFDNEIDLSELPGLDVSRILNLQGARIEDNKLIRESPVVMYQYDLHNRFYPSMSVGMICVNWDTDKELFNNRVDVKFLFGEGLYNWETDEQTGKYGEYYNGNGVISEADKTLWRVTDCDNFNIEKMPNVSEYIGDKVYFETDEYDHGIDFDGENRDVLYLDTNSTLYCNDKKVAENVIKYDKYYALTGSGDMVDLSGKVVLNNVKDFMAPYSSHYLKVYRYYLVLTSDGQLYQVKYGEESDQIKIDDHVVSLTQGAFSSDRFYASFHNLVDNTFGMYLKETGDLYACRFIPQNMECLKISEQAEEILEYNVVKKNDNTVWYVGYFDGTFYEMKLFDNTMNIVKVENSKKMDRKYVCMSNDGDIENYTFVDSNNHQYSADFDGNLVEGKHIDNRIEKIYNYNGIIANVTLKENCLYVDDVLIMTNVTNMTTEMGGIVFSRADGTLWSWMRDLQNGSDLVPTIIHTFTGANEKIGDITGDSEIDVKDVAFLKRYLAGWDVEIDEKAADVNGDGEVNIKDGALLKRYLAGWEVTFSK